jgi:putative spermidine/putrescine transport system substrate-binding protein
VPDARLPPYTPAADPPPRPLPRRSLLRLASVTALLGLAGCGQNPDAGAPSPPPTPAAPSLDPTASQPPIASPVAGYGDPERWAGRVVTIASQGGPYQEAQTEVFFDPFAAATGARVRQEGVDLDEMRRQVAAEQVTWDLADIPADQLLALARDGLLQPIDYQLVDKSRLAPEVVFQHGLGVAFFSTVIAHPPHNPPAQGWADFWNPAAFPGPRALRRGPVGTLEFALLADAVPIADLYPLDLDRAFRSLDLIRPHVAQWYDNALQPVELLLNGGATLASTFNVLAEVEGAAAGIAVQWHGGMLSAQCWVVPRGAANGDVAMDLINFATRAVPSANFSRLLPYGPVNADALDLIRPDRLLRLPTAPVNRSRQFVQNWNWWLDNQEAVTARFDRWLLEEGAPADQRPSTPT